jgi:hypothetical protein
LLSSFLLVIKPTPGRFSSVIHQLRPSEEGMGYYCITFTFFNSKDSSLIRFLWKENAGFLISSKVKNYFTTER